jgi:hypothetical protein
VRGGHSSQGLKHARADSVPYGPHTRRCYKIAGLTLPETQDCVKAAALSLKYKPSRPTSPVIGLQQQLDDEVAKRMAVSW